MNSESHLVKPRSVGIRARDGVRGIDRRALLGGGLALTGLSVPALSACSVESPPTPTPSPGTGPGTLPTYVPYLGTKADKPATGNGAQPAFTTYPAERPRVYQGTPFTSGGTVTANAILFVAPTPKASNRYWQEIDRRLGGTFNFQGVPTGQYNEKLQAMIAGDDLPECVQLLRNVSGIVNIPRLPQVLEAMFQPITDLVAGDAVKEFPGLANIPTQSWRSTVHNGQIFGVPKHRTLQQWSLVARKDLADQLGVGLTPTTGAEFLAMCKALTDARNGAWADRSPVNMLALVSQMVGVPNQWRVDDGTFVSAYTTDEMRQALSIVAGMWKDGMFHPESFGSTSAQVAGWITTGAVRMVSGPGPFGPSVASLRAVEPEATLQPLVLPKWDGGGVAPSYLGDPLLSFTAVRKGVPAERVQEIVRMMDYFASPFGTEEALFLSYGIEGHNFDWKDGNPVRRTGNNEIFPVQYVAAPPVVHYMPGNPDEALLEYECEKSATDNGMELPTSGLYSDADQTVGASIGRVIADAQMQAIKSNNMSPWDDAVELWLKNGGNKISAEYSEALRQA